MAVSSKALPRYSMDRTPNIVGPQEPFNRESTPRAMLVGPTMGVAPSLWPMGLLVAPISSSHGSKSLSSSTSAQSPNTFSSVSGTKDLQMANLTLSVLSRPEVTCLPQIVQALGLEYDEKVLPLFGNEVLKAVVAQFNVDQLLTECPQERRAAIIRAEGESESAKMISEATEKARTGLIELRKIEAMREF
nr:prohibitin-3, mitochondrial [Quercus suber]